MLKYYNLMKGQTNMTLKELRKKRSLTQIALANELGVSGKTVSLIEVGKLKLSKKLSDRIQEVYGELVEPVAVAAEAAPETEKKVQKRGRKAKADKPAAEVAAETPVETEEKAVKKARRGRPAKAAAAKEPEKAAAKKNAPAIVIQSPFGGEITPDEILAKIGEAETVYVRVDQNKAYWVKGEETGAVDLW